MADVLASETTTQPTAASSTREARSSAREAASSAPPCDSSGGGFTFPQTRYAHENTADPLCVAGLERNARDLVVAAECCPDSPADVEDHLARLHPRLGVTRGQALSYCDVGIALERLPRLADLLEERPFLSFPHLKAIATAVYCLADEHLDEFCDRVLEYLAPRREGQAMVGWLSLSRQLCHIVEVLQPEVRPPDPPDDSKPPDPAEDPSFGVDERSPTHVTFTATMKADEGREFLDCLDAVARAHGCGRRQALLELVREPARVEVVFNVYREVNGTRAWMPGVGWLDAVATENWTARATHLRCPGPCSADGYRPTDAMIAFLEGRDGTCRFPGCDRPVHRCDKDHVQNYDHEHPERGGPTSTANMHCLCRKHHNLKTAGFWNVEIHPGGGEVWSSHDGEHKFVTMPQGPLARMRRQTFDQRLTRKTAVLREHNARREAAEEEARRITRGALASERDENEARRHRAARLDAIAAQAAAEDERARIDAEAGQCPWEFEEVEEMQKPRHHEPRDSVDGTAPAHGSGDRKRWNRVGEMVGSLSARLTRWREMYGDETAEENLLCEGLYGTPGARAGAGTHPDAGLSFEEKREKYPDLPPF